MWLTQGNLFVKVSRASDAETEWLRSRESGLTFGSKKHLFTTGEIELTRFFSLIDQTFPAGFLDPVRRRAEEAGFEVKVIDGRVRPKTVPPAVPLEISEVVSRLTGVGWLRDYQREAVATAVQKEHGIIKAPTGSGKTEIAVGITKQIPVKWLFLVHRKTLLEQTAQRYEARCPGEVVGRIGDGSWTVGARFTVATFQSLVVKTRDASSLKKLATFLAQFEGVLVDECHVLPAESFQKIAMMLTNAYWRIGLSGTPLDREDQRSVYAVGALGPQIYEIASQKLIAEGRLAMPIIRMVPVKQEFKEVDSRGLMQRWGWQQVYEEGVVRSKVRNRALLAAVAKAEKPALVFVKDIAHGRAFTAALKARGTKCDFVWGKASLHTRQAIVKRLERGDLDVVVCSVIFQEGVDIPELRSVLIGSAGKSVIAALQRIGRGMRRPDGKTTFEVWDIADEGNGWLRRHAQARRHAYQREGYSVSIVALAPSTLAGGRAPDGKQLELG